jgi:hypothetical protein
METLQVTPAEERKQDGIIPTPGVYSLVHTVTLFAKRMCYYWTEFK